MLLLQGVSYTHSNKNLLFSDISLTVERQERIAIAGNNGIGKSTLLKVMARQLTPSAGTVVSQESAYYVPQHFGQFNELTVAQVLRIDKKLAALKAITEGDASEYNFEVLLDDWSVEERAAEALQSWGLHELALDRPMRQLSGGQKTKVMLAGISIHQPAIILLDEPTNHLDLPGRKLLYSFVEKSNSALVIVSHDRELLNMIPVIYELSPEGLTRYGGNYSFYETQKKAELNALAADVHDQEKALRKARLIARETAERQQKLDARGKKKQVKSGLPTISLNTFRNNAEKSTAKTKAVHENKTSQLQQQLQNLRNSQPDHAAMRLELDYSLLHRGKVLAEMREVNVETVTGRFLWSQPIDFLITSGMRLAISGANGSGKTTLVDLLLGKRQPDQGTISRQFNKAIYLDQDYAMMDRPLSVYEMVQQYNDGAMQESEVKSRLSRFLFTHEHWEKPCNVLSGGEKMRLLLCCLTLSKTAPELIILDEPTNNLDLQNIEILTTAIASYQGTVLAISHDRQFLEDAGIEETVML